MATGVSSDTIQLARDLQAAKWYYTGGSALIAYDYCLTFREEIEWAWQGKKSPVFYLFLLNRYFPIAFCFITLFAYFSPQWTFDICNRFAIVEWLQTVMVVVPAEIILLFRVYALTGQRRSLLFFLVSIICAQMAIVIYAMSQPGKNNALPLPNIPVEEFHICILFSDPHMDTAYLATSISFDSVVFFLTLLSTISVNLRYARPSTPLLWTIQRDGTIYFFVIFSGNLIWMLFSLHGRPGLKLMNAQPSLLLTSIMINRLTLSLRKASRLRGLVWGLKTFEWVEPEGDVETVHEIELENFSSLRNNESTFRDFGADRPARTTVGIRS